MKYRLSLRNIENLSKDNVQERINKGYRFIIYPYCISLVISNINAVSPAFFLSPKDDRKKQGFIYNVISLIFGWWSIPYGPSDTINSVKTNLKGGIDITDDVMINLTNDSLNSKKLKIEQLFTIFSSVQKSTKKNFLKAIDKTNGINNQDIYIGKYINTEATYYFLAFESISDEVVEKLKKNLRKIFYDHVLIEIMEIDKEDEIHLKLMNQGEKLK
ncbi:hypothetical protein [Tenacibaculum halocynthiae]|uniref:hypothetical protein n=1 Tax=Tenacibaculum halocynthiae TaxID=1254437 RepID=UPI0038953614